jgi:hypothetical protein
MEISSASYYFFSFSAGMDEIQILHTFFEDVFLSKTLQYTMSGDTVCRISETGLTGLQIMILLH